MAWYGKDECCSLHAEGLLLNFELQLPVVELLALRLQLLLRHNLILDLQHHISLQWQALIWVMWKRGVSEGTDALNNFPGAEPSLRTACPINVTRVSVCLRNEAIATCRVIATLQMFPEKSAPQS